MTRLAPLLLLLLALPAGAPAAEFHVAPAGSPAGDGSEARPWDLATALRHPAAVEPGDTIWVHGGTYPGGDWMSRLKGTPEQPIVVRAVPGERAVIDSGVAPNLNVFTVTEGSGYTWFWGLEVANSDPQRTNPEGGSYPGNRRGNGVMIHAPGTKWINGIVRDTGTAIGAYAGAPDAEIYGNVIYYNGWDASDRGHGHGVYVQNSTGMKLVENNVIFKQFGAGIHAYGSDKADLVNIEVRGNICFENGALSTGGLVDQILIGGGRVAVNPRMLDNVTYASHANGDNEMGYQSGATGALVRGNYLVGGRAFNLTRPRPLPSGFLYEIIEGNTFVGPTGLIKESVADPAFPGTTYGKRNSFFVPPQRPTGTVAFLRPNKYEPGRAHLAVFNWDGRASAAFDLSAAGLDPGQRFEVRDVQDLWGEPVYDGAYEGEPVTLPLDRTAVMPAVGNAPVPPVHTDPLFNCFLVLPGPMVAPEPEPEPTPEPEPVPDPEPGPVEPTPEPETEAELFAMIREARKLAAEVAAIEAELAAMESRAEAARERIAALRRRIDAAIWGDE